MKCDLCGSEVKVVGNVTKHYEPVKNPWQNKCESLQKRFDVLNKAVLATSHHIRNHDIIEASVVRGLIYQAEEDLRKLEK